MHLAGLYFLWVSFLITFGKRIPISAGYVLRLESRRRRGGPDRKDRSLHAMRRGGRLRPTDSV